jgi:hypothetical protein
MKKILGKKYLESGDGCLRGDGPKIMNNGNNRPVVTAGARLVLDVYAIKLRGKNNYAAKV